MLYQASFFTPYYDKNSNQWKTSKALWNILNKGCKSDKDAKTFQGYIRKFEITKFYQSVSHVTTTFEIVYFNSGWECIPLVKSLGNHYWNKSTSEINYFNCG